MHPLGLSNEYTGKKKAGPLIEVGRPNIGGGGKKIEIVAPHNTPEIAPGAMV